jgi:hypothetical protein
MADAIRVVDYFYLTSSDKPGEGARILSIFREAGIDFLVVHAFPTGRRVQVDVVPKDAAAFLKAARKAKIKLSRKKKAFLAMGDDRAGVLADILDKVGQAKVNVTAMTGLCAGKGRYGVILWVKPKDVRRAAKALGI